MDLALSALVVTLMLGGALAFVAGLVMTFIKKYRRLGALQALIGVVAFVAGTILGQFTA